MALLVYELDHTESEGETEDPVDHAVQSAKPQEEVMLFFVNKFDVDVNVSITGTRQGDTDFDEAMDIISRKRVRANESGRHIITEVWELLEISVTPKKTPTTGTFQIYRMDDKTGPV